MSNMKLLCPISEKILEICSVSNPVITQTWYAYENEELPSRMFELFPTGWWENTNLVCVIVIIYYISRRSYFDDLRSYPWGYILNYQISIVMLYILQNLSRISFNQVRLIRVIPLRVLQNHVSDYSELDRLIIKKSGKMARKKFWRWIIDLVLIPSWSEMQIHTLNT